MTARKEAEKSAVGSWKIISKNHQIYSSLALIGLLIIGLYFVDLIRVNFAVPDKPIALGATFSKPYAESLGIDWRAAYLATLDDLKVRRLRIPAYWDDIEPEPGVYNWQNVDWQLEEAAKRGATVILAVGRKLPRWPECRVPAWAEGMDEALIKAKILTMIEATVRHYADNPTVVMWQVENEPFFEFGLCPEPDRGQLKSEIQVVRALDKRPIMVTESGELSTWLNAASMGDVLGISTYRVVWAKYIGYFYWPITPLTYRERGEAIRSFVDDIIVSELQAEPWVTKPFNTIPMNEQLSLMNPQRLSDNIRFVRRIGFPAAYLWGIEWWYWLKQIGRPEMWEAGQRIFQAEAGEVSQ